MLDFPPFTASTHITIPVLPSSPCGHTFVVNSVPTQQTHACPRATEVYKGAVPLVGLPSSPALHYHRSLRSHVRRSDISALGLWGRGLEWNDYSVCLMFTSAVSLTDWMWLDMCPRP